MTEDECTILKVVDTVMDEWVGAFDAPPERQIAALEWLSSHREKSLFGTEFSEMIWHVAQLPRSEWSQKLVQMWEDSDRLSRAGHVWPW